MGEVIILGSANAVPGENHDNTHLLAVSEHRAVLIDSGNNPLQNLKKAGVEPNSLTDLILTHFHPDHVASAPLLLMDLWLLGRTRELVIHGLADTIDRMVAMMDLYDWSAWPDFYPVKFHRLLDAELCTVFEGDDLSIFSSPVKHLIPTIGLRMVFGNPGLVIAYSSDTEPCQNTVNLAEGADILIHEATGDSIGHSSAEQAGQIAARAGAKMLYLIHYNGEGASGELIKEAGKYFLGPVSMASDFMVLDDQSKK